MHNNWKDELKSQLADTINLRIVSDSLNKAKETGISQDEAVAFLTELRAKCSDETEEDRILEMLDIATGLCQIKFSVWERLP